MTYGSTEFHLVRDQFEKEFKHIPYAYGRLDRENREGASPTWFYQDGQTNVLFHAYMAGFAFAKCALRD